MNLSGDEKKLDVYGIALVIALVLLFLACIRIAIIFQAFMRELRYLNQEIARTTGREQQHYIRRKKRLFLSLIPFVRY